MAAASDLHEALVVKFRGSAVQALIRGEDMKGGSHAAEGVA